jgi:hypothetical protein
VVTLQGQLGLSDQRLHSLMVFAGNSGLRTEIT